MNEADKEIFDDLKNKAIYANQMFGSGCAEAPANTEVSMAELNMRMKALNSGLLALSNVIVTVMDKIEKE